MKTQKFTRRKAFTFIEIMFVVVIIGVLLAVAVPRLTGQSRKAREEATKLAIKNVSTALKRYELEVGAFPEELADLMEDPDEAGWDGPYLESDPVDSWTEALEYERGDGDDFDFRLWSKGRDKQDGTDDDIKPWIKETDE